MSRPRIACLGEAMVEERVAADGALTTHYGGDTLNTAIHLARLGNDVAYVTAIGRDAQSDALICAWRAEGLDTSLVMRHPARGTGRYRIAVDGDGERCFSYARSDSAAREMFALEGVGKAALQIERAGVFIFSLISLAILPADARQSLLQLARAVRSNGGLVAYDGNYRPALWDGPGIACLWHDQAVALCDIGLPTLEDEAALRGGDGRVADTDAVGAHWSQLGCREVLVKSGASGCRLPDGTLVAPPEALSPTDTSGAGDAFNAGYLHARLAGRQPRDAALAGHRVAGWTILRSGAIPDSDDRAPYAEL